MCWALSDDVCEDCQLKQSTFGLKGEKGGTRWPNSANQSSAGRARRWCSDCAASHVGAICKAKGWLSLPLPRGSLPAPQPRTRRDDGRFVGFC